MPKYTNKCGIPRVMVKAILNDPYDRGDCDFSATELIAPAQIEALKIEHDEAIELDVSDMYYTLDGQATHVVLERAAESLRAEGHEILAEKRFYGEVDGAVVSAQIDILYVKEALLQDYKNVSVYSIKDGPKEDYIQQLNIQAWLVKHGYYLEDGKKVFGNFAVNKIEMYPRLRDWSKSERWREVQRFGQDARYPEHQGMRLECPLWSDEEVLTFLRERIHEHLKARIAEPTPCSEKEMWADPDRFAVMKVGVEIAKKLCDTPEAAELHMATLVQKDKKGGKYFIERRPAIRRRCEMEYCPVSRFCKQFQTYKEGKKK